MYVPAPAPVPVVPPPAPANALELIKARARIAELEQQLQGLVARLAAIPVFDPAKDELVKARRTIAEQEERLNQLQQMWYDKEKESRAAQATAQRAQQDRKFALEQIEVLLKEYHQVEVDAATARINTLNSRLEQFLSQRANRPI